jgi:hypothetical protein
MGLAILIAIHVKNLRDLLHYMDNAWYYEMDPTLIHYAPYAELFPAKQAALLKLWD